MTQHSTLPASPASASPASSASAPPVSPAVVSSELLWAAYRRQGRVEDQAWQRYQQLSDSAREAFVAWSLAKYRAEQAYVAYRQGRDVERSVHAPRPG